MRGLFHRLFPYTPDSAGACAMFADTPAIIIPVDMNGTVSTFRSRVGVEEGSPVRVCSALGARELSYVLGDDEALLRAFEHVVESEDGDFVVLVQGPVSSLMGLHLAGLAPVLEQRVRKPVLSVECSGSRHYGAGLAAAMRAVLDRVDVAMPIELRPQEGAYNVIGLNSVDHNDARQRWAIAEAIVACEGRQPVSYWGCFGGWGEWCYARTASRNVVAGACGAQLAREMERRWGVPFVCLDDMPIPWCSEAVAASLAASARGKRVLVVGEQISASIVRRALRGDLAGMPVAAGEPSARVDVACFFDMLPEKREEADIRLASEDDCDRLLSEGGYDFVVCDRALADFDGMRAPFYDLPHSAVGRPFDRRREGDAVALSEDWFRGLADALSAADAGEGEGRDLR